MVTQDAASTVHGQHGTRVHAAFHGFTLHIVLRLRLKQTYRKVPCTHSTDYPLFYALAAQAAPTTRWECDIAREVKNAKV